MNSVDKWMMREVNQEIQRIAGVDEGTAKEYIEGYDFKGYLMEDPLDVRHKSPSEWAEEIVEYHQMQAQKPKPINKQGKSGLTREKKEILKRQQGSASVPVDLNTIREWAKYGESFGDDDSDGTGVWAVPREPNEVRVKVRALYDYCRSRGVKPIDLKMEEMQKFLKYPEEEDGGRLMEEIVPKRYPQKLTVEMWDKSTLDKMDLSDGEAFFGSKIRDRMFLALCYNLGWDQILILLTDESLKELKEALSAKEE